MKNFWNLKLSKLLLPCLIAVPLWASAQYSEPVIKLKSDEKYLYPINPGTPGSLAGTMGELRSTHFHSGIDIRTNNMVGMQVHASKSGYISRATVSADGYGNVLYVTHPDGNTTLYAHLDKFLGPCGDSILKARYSQKTSEIDLFFNKGQFPVKQGDIIALSGNTGSSSGPHVHFDIRDSSNLALDPLMFGFAEIVDKYPPAAEKIAFQTLDVNARVNDRFGRIEFYAERVGNNYVLSEPILANGNIGIEIIAKDRLTLTNEFYGGVNYFEVEVDNKVVFNQAVQKVNVAETRNIYTFMDFKTMRSSGERFYKLYISDGNELKFYDRSPGSGKINITGTQDKLIKIKMKDSYGNASTLSFTLRPSTPIKEIKNLERLAATIPFYDITENVMMVTAKPCIDSAKAKVFTKGTGTERGPDYYNAERAVYLFDLRKQIPDSVVICGKAIVPKINASIPSGIDYNFYSDSMEIQFSANSLYDTLYLNSDYYAGKSGEIFTIGQRTYPLKRSMNVTLKPRKEYDHNKYSVYRMAGKGFTFIGGTWTNNKINFTTREFGSYTLLSDITPPTIKALYINNLMARFRIRDNLSGIASFEATLNGQWILLNLDSKSNIVNVVKLDDKKPLKGDFELVVTDNAGNKQIYKHKIL